MIKAFFLIVLLPIIPLAASEVLDMDPSTIPIELKEGAILSNERYRIRGDFNFDGRKDLALSKTVSGLGKASLSNFQFYLRNEEGKFVKHGEPIYLCICLVSIEKTREAIRIWTYERTGPETANMGYYVMTKDGFMKQKTIEIYNRGPSTKIGTALGKAVFENSDVELITEISETTGDKVTWKPIITRKTEPKEAVNKKD